MKLDIPFITQTNNSIRNDCGPACVAACVGIQIEAVINVMNLPANSYFSVQDVLTALRHYGLRGRYTRPITIPDIHHSLSQRQPAISSTSYTGLLNTLARRMQTSTPTRSSSLKARLMELCGEAVRSASSLMLQLRASRSRVAHSFSGC